MLHCIQDKAQLHLLALCSVDGQGAESVRNSAIQPDAREPLLRDLPSVERTELPGCCKSIQPLSVS